MKTSSKLLLAAFLIIIVGTIILLATIRSNMYKDDFNVDIDESGDAIEQIRDVETFSSINVRHVVEVIITQDTFQLVKVEAEENVQKSIITEVRNNELQIYSTLNQRHKSKFRKNKKVYLTVDSLNFIKAYKGALIRTSDSLKGNTLEIELNDGAIGVIEINFNELNASISSGALLNLDGNSKKAYVSATAGGIIKAHGFKCNYLDIKASAGGIVNAGQADIINIKANSGSIIKYSGESKIENLDVNSGAQITKY